MRMMYRLISCLVALFAISVIPLRAAETCPFISGQQLAGAMPAAKWSLISTQDGRGCIFQGANADVLMLTVFRNPTIERARELYATFVKTLAERMPAASASGIAEEAQAGTTKPDAARQEAAVIALAGEYILSLSMYRSGRSADEALLKPLSEVARLAVGNVSKTSEKFGACEWLTADDADGFLDKATLTIQRTGAASCMMFDRAANTMVVAVIAMSRDTQVNMMKRNGPCQHVALLELGKDAFGEHSCTKGNANAVNIYVWRNGRQASILFAPVKPHPESGSVDRLKAVAGRVYGRM
jgi:hypothetical protein